MAEEKNIDIGGDEQEIEVVVPEEEPSKGKPAPKETAAAAEGSDDELAEYSDGVKKRIDRLTFKMRESERREQAALELARSFKAQVDMAQQRANVLDTSLVNEYNSRITTQEQMVNDKLRRAIDRGDIDEQILAQRAMAELAVEKDKIRTATRSRESENTYVAQQPTYQAPPQRATPDPKAENWAEKNTWFGADEPMTLTAFSHHKALVEKEGFDPSGDDYYEELDKRMRRDFPHKFQGRNPQQTVASPRGSVRSENSKTIKLTSSQVAIAKRLGISIQEYARHVKILGGQNG